MAFTVQYNDNFVISVAFTLIGLQVFFVNNSNMKSDNEIGQNFSLFIEGV